MIVRFSRIITSFFGLGYIKRGSATAGAIAGASIFYFIQPIQIWFTVLLMLMVFLLGVLVSSIISKEDKVKDPHYIIIDEVAGCWTALFLIPKSLVAYMAAVLLFRIFDKTKILGIKQIERLPGGWGIMVDDILAGVYANIVLQILLIGYAHIA